MNKALQPKTLVMKFGGTSVGTPHAVSEVVKIVRNALRDWERVVVVTSALSGVTNQLLDSARAAATGDVRLFQATAKTLRQRHLDMIDDLIQDTARQAQVKYEIEHLVEDFSNFCQAISVLGEASSRALDAVAALGERMSVRILSEALESAGITAQMVEATRVIVTDDHYQSANPLLSETRQQTQEVLNPILESGSVPVVTGFIAATRQGTTATLGRGGSDYSAAILAVSIPADEVWIWTDVDGVMSADPRRVPEACTIPVLTFKEVGELAYFGAKVLHPKTIRPVIEAGIGLKVRNTFHPNHPGTRIIADQHTTNGMAAPDSVVKAVTLISGLSLVTLEGRGMLGVPGVAARTFEAVAATGTSVPLISQASSEQSICFAAPLEVVPEIIQALEGIFAREIGRRDIDRVWATEEVVILTAVGEGMRHTPGVAGRIFTALGKLGVNVIAIAQGSSEVSISLVVDAVDADAGLRALHELVKNCTDR
jgi:aspartokinase/homoserine dehydrogenase 1